MDAAALRRGRHRARRGGAVVRRLDRGRHRRAVRARRGRRRHRGPPRKPRGAACVRQRPARARDVVPAGVRRLRASGSARCRGAATAAARRAPACRRRSRATTRSPRWSACSAGRRRGRSRSGARGGCIASSRATRAPPAASRGSLPMGGAHGQRRAGAPELDRRDLGRARVVPARGHRGRQPRRDSADRRHVSVRELRHDVARRGRGHARLVPERQRAGARDERARRRCSSSRSARASRWCRCCSPCCSSSPGCGRSTRRSAARATPTVTSARARSPRSRRSSARSCAASEVRKPPGDAAELLAGDSGVQRRMAGQGARGRSRARVDRRSARNVRSAPADRIAAQLARLDDALLAFSTQANRRVVDAVGIDVARWGEAVADALRTPVESPRLSRAAGSPCSARTSRPPWTCSCATTRACCTRSRGAAPRSHAASRVGGPTSSRDLRTPPRARQSVARRRRLRLHGVGCEGAEQVTAFVSRDAAACADARRVARHAERVAAATAAHRRGHRRRAVAAHGGGRCAMVGAAVAVRDAAAARRA